MGNNFRTKSKSNGRDNFFSDSNNLRPIVDNVDDNSADRMQVYSYRAFFVRWKKMTLFSIADWIEWICVWTKNCINICNLNTPNMDYYLDARKLRSPYPIHSHIYTHTHIHVYTLVILCTRILIHTQRDNGYKYTWTKKKIVIYRFYPLGRYSFTILFFYRKFHTFAEYLRLYRYIFLSLFLLLC